MSQASINFSQSWDTVYSHTVDQQANELIRSALSGLRFGRVQLVVQDGYIIQVERSERHRTRDSKRTTELDRKR